MKSRSIIKSISRLTNDQGRLTLEPLGMDSSFDKPFLADDEAVEIMLDEIRDQYDFLVGFPTTCIRVTRLYPVTIFGKQYFEPYPPPNGDAADDILDIRHQIEIPDGVRFTDCEFFVLYPTDEKDREEEPLWIVLLPCTG